MSSDLNNSLAELTGARQTMLSWVKAVESYAAIPDIYKESCKSILEDCHPFPYVVFTPKNSDNKQQGKITEKLLCEIDGVFHIWEHVDGKVILTSYPLDTMSFLEVGNVLLFSWLTISGLTGDGVASSTTITFNTATSHFLSPFIEKLRPAQVGVEETDWKLELSKFDYLSSINFKLMNYAREGLVRGEKVICSILQPRIRKHIFTIFGQKFYRNKILSHLALLTDKEVILIGDDEKSPEIKGKGERYGGVWQFIPVRNIAAVMLTEAGDGLVTLSIKLAFGDVHLDKVFEISKKTALEDFKKELERMIR